MSKIGIRVPLHSTDFWKLYDEFKPYADKISGRPGISDRRVILVEAKDGQDEQIKKIANQAGTMPIIMKPEETLNDIQK